MPDVGLAPSQDCDAVIGCGWTDEEVPSAEAHSCAAFSGALPDTIHRDAKGAEGLLPPSAKILADGG